MMMMIFQSERAKYRKKLLETNENLWGSVEI